MRAVGAPRGGVVKLVNTAALEAVGPFRGKKISALASSSLVPATFILPRKNVFVHQTLTVGSANREGGAFAVAEFAVVVAELELAQIAV